jgi:hypothetical protein
MKARELGEQGEDEPMLQMQKSTKSHRAIKVYIHSLGDAGTMPGQRRTMMAMASRVNGNASR